MNDIKKVVKISSDIGIGCTECSGIRIGQENFAESINHYVQQHGYRILHIGTESTHDNEQNVYHTTIAILGHE